jgi:peptide/nickel transport system substrate-binding protein
VAVIDARTVTISVTEPDVSFLATLTLGFVAPVCPGGGAYVDAKQPAPPCGAGPFRLGSVDERRVLLERFEGYYLPGRPYLDAIEWHLGVPATAQRYRFERGELDFLTELTGIDAFRYASDPRWRERLTWATSATTNFIFLNTRKEPFDNPHLRRAVAHAVDPSVLPQVRANVAPATRVIPPAVPGPPAGAPMRRHDREAALAEMELGGYPYDPVTGRGGYPKEIDYVTIPDTFEQAAAEIFQQQLARVGLRVRLRLVSFATWVTLITDPDAVAMGWRGWTADYPDPSTFFTPILTTSAIGAEGSQNVSFFSNPELDGLMVAARAADDVAERMALFERAEEIVRDEAPLVPVYVTRTLQVLQPRVRGYRPHPVLPLFLRDVWLDPAEAPP